MSLTIKHALPLDNNLITYLTAMTSSWARKKLPIKKSNNGLAFWNGFFIGLPDFRYSKYVFVIDHPLEQQFSFYSAIAFHESMHAKFQSHKGNRDILKNHPNIPSNLKNLAIFISNIIEDGRVERLGLIKRAGSVIQQQLFRFNLLLSESNWNQYNKISFQNEFETFLNHVINLLFDLVLLGTDFITEYRNIEEEKIIQTMNSFLKGSVLNSLDPDSSIKATIQFFELIMEFFYRNNFEIQNVSLPNFQNQCGHNLNNDIDGDEINFNLDDYKFDFDELKNFFDNPFSNLFSNDNSENKSENTATHDNIEKNDTSNQISNDNSSLNRISNSKKHKRIFRKSNSPQKLKRDFENNYRLIPNYMDKKESQAYSKFVDFSKNDNPIVPSLFIEDECNYIDTFGNDMVIDDTKTVFRNNFSEIEKETFDFRVDDDFLDIYDKLEVISLKSAMFFLKLAGINMKKKDGVGNQKIVLTSQKNGKLQLNGNTLSQLLAGNKFIYNKEMPARINISIDLVILVDLTGSMEFEVHCDRRIGPRIDFVSEATIVLAKTLYILEHEFNLPINFSIIGYSAPDGSTPVLEIMKDFKNPFLGINHAKAILSWYPDGENCDARAIFESVKLLEKNKSTSTNKVIFFLSDGGGEEKDLTVINSIKEEFPNFQFSGPKDYSDAIKYANLKGIETCIFNLENLQNSENSNEILKAFKKYYGENISLIANLNDLIQVFSKSLLEIFKR